MGLLLQNVEASVVGDLYPLQLGESNSLLIVLAAVVLAGIVVVVVLTMMRRSSAMSDEISKQSHAKFEAIKPGSTLTSSSPPPTAEAIQKASASIRTDRTQEAGGYLALKKDLLETRYQLERYIRENSPFIEKQRETLANIEKLENEIFALRDRLSSSGQEFQKLKAAIAEQSIKLQSQRRDIDIQRGQIEKVWEQPELEKIKAEIISLTDRLLITEQELQKIRLNLEEQNMNFKQLRGLGIQTREILGPLQVAPPFVMETLPASFPQTETQDGVTSRTCVNCGSRLDPEDKFCFHCGQRVT